MSESFKNDSSKIIGGEFAIAPDVLAGALNVVGSYNTEIIKDSDNDNVFYFSSGRAALYAVLSSEQKDSPLHISVPDYLCSSVIDTITDLGSNYSFYHIEDNLYPDNNSLFYVLSNVKEKTKKVLLLINYFGLLNLDTVTTLVRDRYPEVIIICDDVQNYYGFGKEKDYDYAFTSIRKWFPVPDGGILKLSKNVRNTADSLTGVSNYPVKSAEQREAGIIQILETMKAPDQFVSYKLAGNILKSYRQVISDKVCLELIAKGEELLDQNYKCQISDISLRLLKSYIVGEQDIAASIRKNNAEYLHIGLNRLGIDHIYESDKIPLFVPMFVDPSKRDAIRNKMFDNNIFCPVHWKKNTLAKEINNSSKIYDMELSLICDQRYDQKDMNKILEILKNECGNN